MAGPTDRNPGALPAPGDSAAKPDRNNSAGNGSAGNGTAGNGSGSGHEPGGAANSGRSNNSRRKFRNKGLFLRRRRAPVYAALDLGTNNCRLLVACPTREGFRVIDAFSRIIRLGEGLSRSGRLSDHAIDRTIEALKICNKKMSNRGVQRARAIATEACRLAANADMFLDRARTEAGIELEIVSRETEARLAVSGCASLLDDQAEGALIFDIGGGSSEIAWLDLSPGKRCCPLEAQDRIRAWTSLQVGVVTLTERYGGIHVTPQTFENMVMSVLELLRAFAHDNGLARLESTRNVHLLGTSGTVTTIAGIHLALPRYERSAVDGCWLTADQVQRVTRQLIAMSYDERAASPCIGTQRADLVLAGCAILEAIRRQWPFERLRVADRGLREGILTTMMAEDGNLNISRRYRKAGGRARA